MEGTELWKVVGVFGAVFLIFVVILLTVKRHPVDRENRNTGRDKFYSQQGYTRENKKDSNINPTIIVIKDEKGEVKKDSNVQIVEKSSDVDPTERLYSSRKSNVDPLKMIFGTPTKGRTFKDQLYDTSSLEKIFGKPKSKD
jgi:hypothetical protein